MKITKSQLKKIIKEELDSMMQEIESGDGMKEFMQAVETIQSVLKDHNILMRLNKLLPTHDI